MPNLTEFVDGSRVLYCTEVRFASFLLSGLTLINYMAVINPPERKLTKRTSLYFMGGWNQFIYLSPLPSGFLDLPSAQNYLP